MYDEIVSLLIVILVSYEGTTYYIDKYNEMKAQTEIIKQTHCVRYKDFQKSLTHR